MTGAPYRLPRSSRTLLLPGPQAPLTHLGATLLRWVVSTGLRYSLYQLGFTLPDPQPLRIQRLRLLLDGVALDKALAQQPGGREVAAALLDSGGVGTEPDLRRLSGAATFHRMRLALHRLPLWPRFPSVDTDPGSPWRSFEKTLSAWKPILRDAVLADLLASLARRERRRQGLVQQPCMSREAARFLIGRKARLGFLGAPDLFSPSWDETKPDQQILSASRELDAGVPVGHALRGRFREYYRGSLDALRPHYFSLAKRAVSRGLLRSADEAFFLPLELASDLDGAKPLQWIEPAVSSNRSEYQAQLREPSPPDIIRESAATVTGEMIQLGRTGPDWALAALNPLP